MTLEFERNCVKVGGSKAIILPPEILTALGLDDGETVVIRYYEKEKGKDTRKYCSFWKKGT
jgi:hypothetical protein